jgi:hypothetical protein
MLSNPLLRLFIVSFFPNRLGYLMIQLTRNAWVFNHYGDLKMAQHKSVIPSSVTAKTDGSNLSEAGRTLGTAGGSVKSGPKAQAAKVNGAKGGRPKK